MVTTQNFDFIDYKVKVEYIDGLTTIDTGYLSRMCYLTQDPSLILPPTSDQQSVDNASPSLQIEIGHDFRYGQDITADDLATYPDLPELSNYFYKANNKSIDILTVGDITDMSKFLASKQLKELNGRCYTIVVDSSLDDETIDPNFITNFNGAFLVTRAVVDELPHNKFGYLFIEELNPEIRNSELLKFSGWFFNRTDFLGQVSMTQIDYETTYWLDMQGLTDVSDSHYIGFGNQNGNTYVSSFFIGDDNTVNFYRKEQVKRSIQQAIFNLLSINNKYNQTTINLCEIIAKKVVNSFSWIEKKATFVQHTVFAKMLSQYKSKKIIPIKMTIAFLGEVDKVIIDLYNIFSIIGG